MSRFNEKQYEFAFTFLEELDQEARQEHRRDRHRSEAGDQHLRQDVRKHELALLLAFHVDEVDDDDDYIDEVQDNDNFDWGMGEQDNNN